MARRGNRHDSDFRLALCEQLPGRLPGSPLDRRHRQHQGHCAARPDLGVSQFDDIGGEASIAAADGAGETAADLGQTRGQRTLPLVERTESGDRGHRHGGRLVIGRARERGIHDH